MSVPDEAEMQLDAVERSKMYQEMKQAQEEPGGERMMVEHSGIVTGGA